MTLVKMFFLVYFAPLFLGAENVPVEVLKNENKFLKGCWCISSVWHNICLVVAPCYFKYRHLSQPMQKKIIQFCSDFSIELYFLTSLGKRPRTTNYILLKLFQSVASISQLLNHLLKTPSIWKSEGKMQTSPWLKSIIHSHLKGCAGPGSSLR